MASARLRRSADFLSTFVIVQVGFSRFSLLGGTWSGTATSPTTLPGSERQEARRFGRAQRDRVRA